MLMCRYVGNSVIFSIYETASFVFGKKAMPRTWNTFIERFFFMDRRESHDDAGPSVRLGHLRDSSKEIQCMALKWIQLFHKT
jgi:hypothetical protein